MYQNKGGYKDMIFISMCVCGVGGGRCGTSIIMTNNFMRTKKEKLEEDLMALNM